MESLSLGFEPPAVQFHNCPAMPSNRRRCDVRRHLRVQTVRLAGDTNSTPTGGGPQRAKRPSGQEFDHLLQKSFFVTDSPCECILISFGGGRISCPRLLRRFNMAADKSGSKSTPIKTDETKSASQKVSDTSKSSSNKSKASSARSANGGEKKTTSISRN